MRYAKYIGFGAVALTVLAFFVAQVFKAEIGERVFARAVDRTLSRDVIGDLPDGLHVVLVGTGSPMVDPTRMGPSTAVIAGNRLFIIDTGSGSPRNLGEMGLPAGTVERVFLTHFHSDHINSLGELMLQRWAGGSNSEPLPIHGPVGVGQIVDGFNLAYGLDREYRIAHHGPKVVPPSGFGGLAMPFEGDQPEVIIQDGDLTITAFPVNHTPVNPAVGYRFDYKGRSVTLTGDTAVTDNLTRAAFQTDLLVSEALNTEMVGVLEQAFAARGVTNLKQIMLDIPDYHMTPVQAAEIAAQAEAEMLVYSHLVPGVPLPYLDAYFTRGTRKAFSGPIIVGQDGMMFSLLPETNKITRSRLK